jgi:hypothetical protein
MTTASIAALLAALVLGFVEGLRRFYPARPAWRRMRRARGRRAMLRMRQRFEDGATQRAPRVLALLFLVLVGTWIGVASLLDKRWHEVLFDVLPYLIVIAAVLRVPAAMRGIAVRMKEYEQEVGDDQVIEDDDPPGAIRI